MSQAPIREYHILSLGAGVQSTALYLAAMHGVAGVAFDAAIFADTQDEPDDESASVYRHLAWLKAQNGPPIIVRSRGRLSEDIVRARAGGGRCASLPAYVVPPGRTKVSGMAPRQCSGDYKVRVVEQVIRQDVLGLSHHQRIPRSVIVHQYFGISLDEAGRAIRISQRFKDGTLRGVPHFPLIDLLKWTRRDCERYNQRRVPHLVPRSACEYCPYHSDAEWRRLKEQRPKGWALAVRVDEALRSGVTGMRGTLYLHRSGRPLAEVDFAQGSQAEFPYFVQECDGVCGT